jgi:hypothetical protein
MACTCNGKGCPRCNGAVAGINGMVEIGGLIMGAWIVLAVLVALYFGYTWFTGTAWPWLVKTEWVHIAAFVAILSFVLVQGRPRGRR